MTMMTSDITSPLHGKLFMPSQDTIPEDIPYKLVIRGCVPNLHRNPSSHALVFVMDASGSMIGEELDNLKQAFSQFVEYAVIIPNLTIHVVLFGSNVTSFRLAESPEEALCQIEHHFGCHGGTDYNLALQKCVTECELLLQENPKREITLIFCSDGQVGAMNAQQAQSKWQGFVEQNYMNNFCVPPRVLTMGVGSYQDADVISGFICPGSRGAYRLAQTADDIPREFHTLLTGVLYSVNRVVVDLSVPATTNVFSRDFLRSHTILVDGNEMDDVFWLNRIDFERKESDLTVQCNGQIIPLEIVCINDESNARMEIAEPFCNQMVENVAMDLESALDSPQTNEIDTRVSEQLSMLQKYANPSDLSNITGFIAQAKCNPRDKRMRQRLRDMSSTLQAKHQKPDELQNEMEARREAARLEQERISRELAESEAKRIAEEKRRQEEAREAARRAEEERVAYENAQLEKFYEKGRQWMALREKEEEQQRLAVEQAQKEAEQLQELQNCENSEKRVELIEALEETRAARRQQERQEEELKQERIRRELQDRLEHAEAQRCREQLARKELETYQALLDAVAAEELRSQNSEVRVKAIETRERRMNELRARQEEGKQAQEIAYQKERAQIGESVLATLTEKEIATKLEEETARQERERLLNTQSRRASLARMNVIGSQELAKENERARQEALENKAREEMIQERESKTILAAKVQERNLQEKAKKEAMELKLQEEEAELARANLSSDRLVAEEELQKQREEERIQKEAKRRASEEALQTERYESNLLVVEHIQQEEMRRKLAEAEERTKLEEALQNKEDIDSKLRLQRFDEAVAKRRAEVENKQREEEFAQQQAQRELDERLIAAEEERLRMLEASKAAEEKKRLEEEQRVQRERESMGHATATLLNEIQANKQQAVQERKEEEERQIARHSRRRSEARLALLERENALKRESKSREEQEVTLEAERHQRELEDRLRKAEEERVQRHQDERDQRLKSQQEAEAAMERARLEKSSRILAADKIREEQQRQRLEEESLQPADLGAAQQRALQVREEMVSTRTLVIESIFEELDFQHQREFMSLLANVSTCECESTRDAVAKTFDGVFLNSLILEVIPGCLDMRAVHKPTVDIKGEIPVKNTLVLENIQLFLATCEVHNVSICPSFEVSDWLDVDYHMTVLRRCLEALKAYGENVLTPSDLNQIEAPRSQIFDSDDYISWINSLELVKNSISDLSQDLNNCVTLLKLIDRIQPGVVVWRKVKRKVKNPFQKRDNAAEFIRCCSQVGIKIVGFDVDDVVNGNVKLLHAVLFQMKKMLPEVSPTSSLEEEDVKSEENEALLDAVEMVNGQLGLSARKFCEHDVRTGVEESLSSGLYYLDFLRATIPGAIEESFVCTRAHGVTIRPSTKLQPRLLMSGIGVPKNVADCFSNISYCVSVVRRLGGRVDASTEDLLRINPAAVLSLLQAIESLNM